MTKVKEAYIGLGGNIGNTYEVIKSAIELMEFIYEIKDIQCSPIYQTEPVSSISQPDYLNAVCRVTTTLSATELFTVLKEIEKTLGKQPKGKEHPRVIDLDLLIYEKEQWNESDLQIPHPRLTERLFVLKPLKDLTDHVWLENKQVAIDDLISQLTVHHKVEEYQHGKDSD